MGEEGDEACKEVCGGADVPFGSQQALTQKYLGDGGGLSDEDSQKDETKQNVVGPAGERSEKAEWSQFRLRCRLGRTGRMAGRAD